LSKKIYETGTKKYFTLLETNGKAVSTGVGNFIKKA
jgi:hypothetical protein